MTVISLNTLLAAIFLVTAGCSGLLRHFLLEPMVKTYPKAPNWLLVVFFFFSVTLIFSGLRYFAAWYMGEVTIPPNATASAVFTAFTIMVYKVAMLVNVLLQHYPAQVWARLNRIQALARCAPRA